jgi:23S rRNA pseudouridine1911/1915/1917 synthase
MMTGTEPPPRELIAEEIPAALAGERLDRVVALVAEVPRSAAAELVDGGAVTLDGRTVAGRSVRVATGQLLEVALPEPISVLPDPEPDVQVPVVYEDGDLVVVDKPADLVVHPGPGHEHGTLVHGLLARYPEIAGVGDPMRPGIVHRLDRGTSGLLLVARTQHAYDELVDALRAHDVSRRYDALVWGHFEVQRGLIDAPIGRSQRRRTAMTVASDGREARTHYEVREIWSNPAPCSLLRCELETGRTHQIRVHLAAIGHAVVGDERYGGAKPAIPAARPMLHAAELELTHPVTGEPLHVTSPRPADFEAVLATLA